MNKVKYYILRYKFIVLIVAIITLAFILIPKKENKIDEVSIVEDFNMPEINKSFTEEEKIKIDIKGAVVNPGTYELDLGARVQDAINKAGGLSQNANIEYINLSKKLKDEMVIIIYTNEYIKEYKNKDKEPIYIKYECDCPSEVNDACIEPENMLNDSTSKTEKAEEEHDKLEEKISINTASLEELMTLNGIGESKAKAIIKYREEMNGFKDIEEIKNVSGIGEAAYSKIKDNIKL